jgi:beta-xylosidase
MSGAATGGSKGTGGATSGGAATSTGGVATGGKSATGGDATGGAATGGAAIGGAATGGKSATGGAATAGAAAGGKSATGGASSTGGCGAIGTWNNPILPGLYADPSISVFNCKYYIYPTTDGFANWASTQFHAFSSSDLATWKDEGVILDLGPDVSWAASRAWAPKLVLKNGTYYFYFSADLQIGVATSTSPIGPFKDALGKPLITAGQYGGESIDPYVFTDDDGRSYLFFGSTSAGGHVVELNADMISLNGTPQLNAISGYKEASVVFKRNGKYYFMWSEGDTRLTTYNVAYGTASTPMGPYARAAVNPILQSDTAQGIWATGSNDVLQLSNGDFFIVYHRFAIPNGDGMHREVCLDRLNFNADGTIIPVKPTP